MTSMVTKRAQTNRKVCYVPFKSYHINSPKRKIITTDKDEPKASTQHRRQKKTGKKAPTAGRFVEKHNGDTEERANREDEIDRTRSKVVELTNALRDLQSENESLKQSLTAAVPVDSHERIKSLLDDSERQRVQLQSQLDEARETERVLIEGRQEVEEKLEKTTREHAELVDRVELLVDKVNYLTQQNDDKEQLLREREKTSEDLRCEVEGLATKNQNLCDENDHLERSLKELQSRLDEKNDKLENYENVKRKLQLKEAEMRKTIEEMEVKSKFVELLENENADTKKQNCTLNEQNTRLNVDLTEMKKRLEQLRQKYDEIIRENRLLKEKEARYLIRERINVGKYATKFPAALLDRANLSRPSTARGSSQSRQFANPQPSHSAQLQNRSGMNERMYNLLHRPDDDQKSRR